MDGESKKISFGFNRSAKRTPLVQKTAPKRSDIQLIDCVESQTIKVKGVVEKVSRPLVIPMPSSENGIQLRLKESKAKREASQCNVDEKPDSELTPDELAARELLKEAQSNHRVESKSSLVLPAVTENIIEIEGKEEPTMEDYESIPISDYGLAMLRGMGWNEATGIGKISGKNNATKLEAPALRPKGMGLGADKAASKDTANKLTVDEAGRDLILKKGCHAKIIDGKQKGLYCQVEGFDEDGRVIVKTTLQGLVLSLNEFCVKPVSKEEYSKLSKVLNNAKYEEYKEKTELKPETSSSHGKRIEKNEHNTRERKSYKNDRHRYRKRSRSRHRRERSSSPSNYKCNKSGKKEKSRQKRQNSSNDSDYDNKSKRSKEKYSKQKHQGKNR